MVGPQFNQRPPLHHDAGLNMAPPPNPWWRRRYLLLVGAGTIALTQVAGLITWLVWPTPNREAFDKALTNLAAAKGIRYSSDSTSGGMAWDVTTTASGEAIGSISLAGQKVDVLQVGGKLYVRISSGPLTSPRSKVPITPLEGKWVTGGGGLSNPMSNQFFSPRKLVDRFRRSLSEADFPDEAKVRPVSGIAALQADTAVGTLYVSRNVPYRVLRYIPRSTAFRNQPKIPTSPTFPNLPGQPTPPLPSNSLPPSLPNPPSIPAFHSSTITFLDSLSQRKGSTPQPTLPGDGQMDLSELSVPEVDQTYEKLKAETKKLIDAVDASLQFTLNGNAKVQCGAGGCSVTANFTGKISVTDKARITGGKVTATMTASILIDGRPAGTCTGGPNTFSINAGSVTGQLECNSPEAGAIFSQVRATKRAQAEAQSRASGGRPVPYSVHYQGIAHVFANAMARAEVDGLVAKLEREQQAVTGKSGRNKYSGRQQQSQEQIDRRIAEKLKSKKDADKAEGDIGRHLRKCVIQFNDVIENEKGEREGEIDVGTPKFIIESYTGKNISEKEAQARKYRDNRLINPTRRPAIIYAPNPKLENDIAEIKAFEKETGAKVIRSLDALRRYIRQHGEKC